MNNKIYLSSSVSIAAHFGAAANHLIDGDTYRIVVFDFTERKTNARLSNVRRHSVTPADTGRTC